MGQDQDQIHILYVDDDTSNLNVFKATFRKDYMIFLASSAREGLEIMRNHKIHVVLADQRMPEMTGAEFFEIILKEFPDPIRILITGYSDIESVIGAINKGQVYRYISKPWNERELRIAIENAFEVYDMRQQLQITNKELTKRNDELNRFVYSASHELKAPLRTIAGILKMARGNNSLNPEQYFAMIDHCVKNLDAFIKNIVDYYRNQRYEDYIKNIDFQKMLKDMIENHIFSDNANDINFNLSINQDEPFVNDELRIRVVLNNLLSNCIKYQKKENENKFVSISIKTHKEWADVVFEDNGIGIDEKYVNDIFNMFFRATDYSPGSGIGLYILKEALDKMNGSVEVKSKEGEGTKFIVRIPNRAKELSTTS